MTLKIVDYIAQNPRLFALNLATAVGYMGGFPEPPRIFNEMIKNNPFMKWTMVALLIYQGGGEQDLQLAFEITIMIYFFDKLLRHLDENRITNAKENFY